jgi:aspartyl protease family protein
MKILFTMVVVVGIAIGLAIPVAKTPAPVAAALAAVPASAAVPAEDVPVDTVLDRSERGHFLAVADVNGEPIRFVVDTGADMVALTEEDARRAHVDFDPNQFVVVGKGAGGPVRGQEVRIGKIVLDGKRATDVFGVVLEGADVSLLGHSYLRHISDVQIKGDKMILH